jgi:methylenetetrahydrofolate dehydrogenase (NADP+) / methenyltetrahydrofolate cyclohydrolase
MTEIDVRAAAAHWRQVQVEPELRALGFSPTLVTVRRKGDDGAESYERALTRASKALKVDGHTVHHRAHVVDTGEEVLSLVRKMNADRGVHGILVFYPLQLGNDAVVMNAVSPHKDVEGLHAVNLGYLQQYQRTLYPHGTLKLTVPCTAKAVGKLLDFAQVPLKGRTVLLFNNSLILGRPLGTYLENLGATVVRTFDQTPVDYQHHALARAHIIVTGVPKAVDLFDQVPAGSVVINVSGLRNYPDTAVTAAALHTQKIGPLTCEMALLQTLYVAKRRMVLGENAPNF